MHLFLPDIIRIIVLDAAEGMEAPDERGIKTQEGERREEQGE
jgi:hypothetical protein